MSVAVIVGLLLGIALVVAGIALLSIPAALIATGMAVAGVCLYVDVEPRRRSRR